MSKFKLLGTTFLHSTMFTSALALAAPAMAQDAPAPEPAAEPAAAPATTDADQPVDCVATPNAPECGTIIVTGSRIARPNLDSPVPVTAISGEEFFQTGQVSVGDVLNELPALRSTFTQSNSTRFLGTAGLNLLDLRGLGTVRTLVLQNGRRH
ncbi:MAG: TonB-dependent receptor plug domain-containing protein, partial [Sphingomicrobium sp.]